MVYYTTEFLCVAHHSSGFSRIMGQAVKMILFQRAKSRKTPLGELHGATINAIGKSTALAIQRAAMTASGCKSMPLAIHRAAITAACK